MKANGFTLNGTKVNGNITFDKQEYKDSADLEKMVPLLLVKSP